MYVSVRLFVSLCLCFSVCLAVSLCLSVCHSPAEDMFLPAALERDNADVCHAEVHLMTVLILTPHTHTHTHDSLVTPLIVIFLLFVLVLNLLLLLRLFVCLHLIIGILSFCTIAPLTVLPVLHPVLNLTFSLLPITSSHSYSYASASDSTFDCWRYMNVD